jgi:CheY-like chemotaxis protein
VDAVQDAGGNQRERKTVLVVEDNDDDLVLFQRAAQEANCGLSFHYVDDGEKALAYLEGEGAYTDREGHPFPELVILDLRLLQLDGLEVLEYIRNRPGCKKLEVIVLSGRDDPACIAQALAAGADRFISKPIEAATLQGMAEVLGSAAVVL